MFIPFSCDRYVQKISIIYAADRTIEDLTEEVGKELATELLTIQDINPDVWTTTLEGYIDTVIERK